MDEIRKQPEPAGASAPEPSPAPPRGPSAATIGVVIVTFLVALLLGGLFGPRMWAGATRMAQSIFSDRHEHAESGRFYTCGMHPWVLLPNPGDCPICHMDLEPIDPAKFKGDVTIDPVIVQNIGVRTQPVIIGPLVKTIRTVGTIDYAEPLVRDVSTKIGGWIEKLHVDRMGQQVQAGHPLFEIYSPELYAAQEEYLLAFRSRQLLESSRTKLEYYDITAEQIRALEQADKPAKTMAIRSPHNGVVIEKNANEGMKIDAGTRVYRIADLSKVWVMVTIYEYQLPYLREGQTATMSLPYIPGQTFEGKVIYIYPYLSEKTREVRVRLEFDNPNGLLKPGMFASVEIQNTLADEKVLAPRSAVIDTGRRQVAFVSLGEGRFEPRDVKLGVETEEGMVEIQEGLKAGELVVTSGQFLIDSEARIREALAKMIEGDMAADQKVAVAVAQRGEQVVLPEPAADALRRVLENYLTVGDTLANDSAENIAPPAREIASAVEQMLATPIPGDEHFWHRHEEVATIRGKALELIDARGLKEVRLDYADLSVALAKLTRATGVPASIGQEIHHLHCPMYLEGQGGSTWLQAAGEVRNPYYGSMMLGCFDKREALPFSTTQPAGKD